MENSNPIINVWITKYALNKGIFNIDVEHCIEINVDMVSDRKMYTSCYHRPDWHLTRADAIARAEEMRTKKIASHKKAIKKLEGLSFQ